TGHYPGRARTVAELRQDLEKVLSLVPGPGKVNLHANYLDSDESVSRDALEPKHFSSWADWAVSKGIGLDFNSTFFSHPLSEQGSLTHPDESIRAYWIEHAKRCRRIAAFFGERTGKPCIINHWVHDGAKEVPIDTLGPRLRLVDSLDQIFSETLPKAFVRDAVESKLFGIGSEAYVPGSHEFYMGYVLTHPEIWLTLDAGHFHPTEVISGKISALLCFVENLLLHVSRPVRWDSDHVVLLDDETRQIMREVVRCQALGRVAIALDYFDASINRVAAWVTGARSARKALLLALLEPLKTLRDMEQAGNGAGVLVVQQETLTMPFGIIWDEYCRQQNVPEDRAWLSEIAAYERSVLCKR
ncbi:MAG TPA: L-rhamnose isomerase, partial [Clostridia bacterium]|nr:L-rhamnose isomerase [Clostridia bacterium]